MLEAYIIDELKKAEKERLARENERPRLEIPLPTHSEPTIETPSHIKIDYGDYPEGKG